MFSRAIVDEMQSAMSDFRKVFSTFSNELQHEYQSVSVSAIPKLAAHISHAEHHYTEEDQQLDYLIASYICSQSFLSVAYKKMGNTELFHDTHFKFFKHLIDLPLPFTIVREQTQEMIEMWSTRLQKAFSAD